MADIDYRTGGGGSTLTTRSPGFSLAAANAPAVSDFSGLAGALIAKREEEAQRRRDQEAADRAEARENERYAMRLAAKKMGGEEFDPIAQQVKQAEQVGRLEQLQALSGPAPTRMVHGAQIISGKVLDPLAMNAYQRQAFLPQGATGVESVEDRERSAQDFEREESDKARAEREKVRASGGQVPAPAPARRY